MRDADGLKTVLPKGVQVARENVERAVSTGQEVLGRTLKTNEAIGQIAKGQFEAATAQAQDNVKTAPTTWSRPPRPSNRAVDRSNRSALLPAQNKNPAARAAGFFVGCAFAW